ncbi:GNAT family N-acetyltransferase [Mediterraneibacter agrestimuris]|uniref:GNAT family N-acetyltransferase n=1 Tax=Mediterraneibacter agrestimuris TaxID=2941333 RepID=UPI00203FDDD5|nr:GNAT family N-acetyltransferase [Mediterraneibacter agrestimuris]
MSIKIVPAYEQKEDVSVLFSEYTKMLIENDESFKKYLDIQNYDKEINHLEMKYGMPDGRLYLIYCDEKLAGCIGLRKIDDQNCEMKRLYIRPEFRGKKLSSILVEKVIEDAKKIGYSYMLLDTLPFLQSAVHIYKKFGFYEIESYNNSPMDTSIYMKLDL